jgi:hypothetical protein
MIVLILKFRVLPTSHINKKILLKISIIVILEKYVMSKIEIKSLILILMILIAILNFKNDKHYH